MQCRWSDSSLPLFELFAFVSDNMVSFDFFETQTKRSNLYVYIDVFVYISLRLLILEAQ